MKRNPRWLDGRVVEIETDGGVIHLTAKGFWDILNPEQLTNGADWRANEFRRDLKRWARESRARIYCLTRADLIILSQVIRQPLKEVISYRCKGEEKDHGRWRRGIYVTEQNEPAYWRYSCPKGHSIFEIGVEGGFGDPSK